ncbi:hypothetical protein SO694_00125064 [Aureococcus anophagefferens]|uniref:Uncharacterized protein n=1 Tax=Aureococcus anophagefferens TaxID=44056 RepID=A0ABR1G2V9_AURAN
MMGQATEADTYRTVEFQRDGVAVACGGTYEPGATYAATMSPLPPGGGGVLFDLSGGVFDDDCTCPYECAGDSASWHKKSDAASDAAG